MTSVQFLAFLDTCALYGAALSDTLLRLAEQDAYQPRWSSDVLDELSRNLQLHAGLAPERAARRIAHMEESFPAARVTGYGHLIDSMQCNPKDRHVLAAASQAHCQVLVTFNLRDFPGHSVRRLGLTVVHPADFLLDQLELYPDRVAAALQDQAAASARPPLSYGALLDRLRRAGVGAFVDALPHEFGPEPVDQADASTP